MAGHLGCPSNPISRCYMHGIDKLGLRDLRFSRANLSYADICSSHLLNCDIVSMYMAYAKHIALTRPGMLGAAVPTIAWLINDDLSAHCPA